MGKGSHFWEDELGLESATHNGLARGGARFWPLSLNPFRYLCFIFLAISIIGIYIYIYIYFVLICFSLSPWLIDRQGEVPSGGEGA